MPPLEPQEQDLFQALQEYIDSHGYSPGIRELKAGVRVKSTSKVQGWLKSLKRKGYINWIPQQSRSYHILIPRLPVLGVVQAGFVVEHPADLVDRVSLPPYLHQPNLYALRVCGDSMVGAHICDGDLVLLRPRPDLWSLRRDAIVCVWVNGEGTTLKYIEHQGKWVHLKPANPAYPVRRVDLESIEIQGVVVHVHRNYDSCA